MIPHHPLAQLSLVAESESMREVVTQIAKAAGSPAGLMIAGEPGTGRTLVARAVHAGAHADGAPFVSLDCRVLLPSEAERTLFGAPPNGAAANGTTRSSSGLEIVHAGSLLHAARGGTILFRHVDELPMRVQARLATLFRDREFKTRLNGGAQVFTVRPVAVVEPGFDALVDDGRVRPDLYRRFAEFQIQVPALRDRREDIPGLARLFLSTACRAAGVEEKSLDASAETVLSALPWHGNVREMKDLLESLAQVSEEIAISLRTLLEHVTLDAPNGVHPTLGVSLKEARQRFEREYIAAVVAQHHGRIPDAARSLGIQRTNLYRKLRALKLGHSEEAANGARRPVA